MSSYLYNKALQNVKFKNKTEKIQYSESEMSDHLKSSFNLEFNNIVKSIELKKLQKVLLFEFLSKYNGKVPALFFYKNIMKLGEILITYKYFTIANNECYERYLVSVLSVTVEELCCDNIEKTVGKCFVDDGEISLELTVSALFGVCRAQLGEIESIDPFFDINHHRERCKSLLQVYSKVMEMILPQEKCCWLIYNGTVHIYEVCQKLIRCQHSIMAVEPLIWASCCLETSIPLLTLSNLKWRVTLYTAVCQALYNCGQDSEAERFARRGLVKINELNTLYEMSSESLTVENALIITESTIKMAVMIFKRAVFEIRRRPKTYLRPKTKLNFKELLQGNWPRTGTERLLAEMFESPSQQALAIVEALKQPLRTLGKIGSPAAENDWDILDVYSELFYSFTAILTGRSSISVKAGKGFIREFKVADPNLNDDQLTLAVRNSNEVTANTVFDMICWAFTYGNWEFVDMTIEPLTSFLKDSKQNKETPTMLFTLQLLVFMRKAVLSSKIDKKSVKLVEQVNEDDKTKEPEIQDHLRSNLGSISSLSKETKSSKSKREYQADEIDEKQKIDPNGFQDPLFRLAEFLKTLFSKDNINISSFSKEILIEAGTILWSKCKSILHSVQDGSLQNKVLLNISTPGKWIYILFVTHRLFSLINYSQLNPVSFAEISTRLCALLEEISLEDGFNYLKSDKECVNGEPSINEFIDSLKCEGKSRPEKSLIIAKEILQNSIDEMNKFRGRFSMNKSPPEKESNETICRNNSLDDIYLELNSLFFRISIRGIVVRLCLRQEDVINLTELKTMEFYKECLALCNKNTTLKALFYASVAKLLFGNLSPGDVAQLANSSRSMLEKAKENISVIKTVKVTSENVEKLPPPIIMERGSDFIIVKIDEENISQDLKEKIGWVRLYGRPVDSPNAEVRLTDDKLLGTGLETSSMSTLFRVRNLKVNEQYILAFAAFDKFGSMIGRGIGSSTKKILAVDSFRIMAASALIAQMFYEVGLKEEVIRYEKDLWEYVMEPLPEPAAVYRQSMKQPQFLHHNYKVKEELLNTMSSMFLRQFCLIVMSAVDCKAQLNSITSEISFSTSCHINDQILRLGLCDRLLAMFAISKKLKNHTLTMDIFANIVNLVVPLMNHNQFYLPFAEILMLSITTLHNLPQTTWIKIPSSFKTNLHHMIASVGFFLLKYYNMYDPSNENLDSIRNSVSILLQMSSEVSFTVSEQEEVVHHSNVTSRLDNTNNQKQPLQIKKTFVKGNKADGAALTSASSHQIAFETYKYTMVIPNSSTFSIPGRNFFRYKGAIEQNLTGTDEPDILLAFIANLPSKVVYKEVIKFSRKTRYLQFVVEVAHKAMTEGNLDFSLNVYRDIREWIRKRNEMILGRTVLPPPSQMNVDSKRNENPDITSFKEQLSRQVPGDEEPEKVKKNQKSKKKAKYKTITVSLNMSEEQKQLQEEAELKAMTVLTTTLPYFYKQSIRRKKFRQVSLTELSSRIKLNCSISSSYLGLAQNKIDALIQMLSAGYQLSEIPEIEDVTQYMLNNTGIVLPLNEIRGSKRTSAVLKITKRDKDEDRPRTFRPDMKFQEKRLISEAPKLLSQFCEHVNKVGILLKKAIVLSDRGQNWLLLSRACSLSRYALTVIMNISVKFENFVNAAKIEYPDIDWRPIQPLSLSEVFKIFLDCFYFGSDTLMHVMEGFETNRNIKNFDEGFIENYVLQTLHILYETNKYERFVHIVLRFTKLTKSTFVTITHPLLIKSQQCLMQISKEQKVHDPNWSEDMSKQHILQCLEALQWSQIDSSNYLEFLKIRESGKIGRVNWFKISRNNVHSIKNPDNNAIHIKNMMSVLTVKDNFWPLFSVPVDSEVSLQELKAASCEKSTKRMWNEICHKRQLYFYQKAISNDSNTVYVSFNDLTQSYKELIALCTRDGLREYCGMLQRDLGDIYMMEDMKVSRSILLWNTSLQNLLNNKNPFEYLSQLLSNDYGALFDSISDSKTLVEKFGILTCLEIGGVLTRIIRYNNFSADKRKILCLYAASFFKTVYGTSLVHPEQDMRYLDQELTLDFSNPIPLLINMHLSSHQSRNDIQDLESQLWFLIDELIQAGHLKLALPLMSFYEHIVSTYLRDSLKCIKIRILKLDVSIQLKQLRVASKILFQLFVGDRWPQFLDLQTSQGTSKAFSEAYNDSQQILDDNNMTVLDRILSKRINPNVAQRIGQALSDKISTLQAKFLLEIASNINSPSKESDSNTCVSSEGSSSVRKSTVKKNEIIANQSEDKDSVLEQLSSKLKFDSWKKLSLPHLRGVILRVASEIIQPIIDGLLVGIQKENQNIWRLENGQPETVILGLLVQARIRREQSYNRVAARLAMFAAKVIKEMNENVDNMTLEQHGERRSINIRLHLHCSKEIVECLLREVGIGQILDFEQTSISDVPDLKALILSSISESDEHNLYQEKAWFVAALAKFAIYTGFEAEKYISILKESLTILEEEVVLSEESEYLQNECRFDEANVKFVIEKSSFTDYSEKNIIDIQNNVLRQLDKKYSQSVYWNSKDAGLSQALVRNCYDNLYFQLAQIKLLLAIINLKQKNGSNEIIDIRLRSLKILNVGLEITRKLSNRRPWLEVEFLMMIGRLQRYLIIPKKASSSTAISTLVEGLKLSIASSGHLGIQKQFFLELTLTFMVSSGICSNVFNEHDEIITHADISHKALLLMKLKSKDEIVEASKYRKLSWLALKCASNITSCMKKVSQVKNDSSRLLSEENIKKLPISICFDLFGRFLLGDKRIIYKNDIEKELSRMAEARVPRDSENIEDQLDRIKNFKLVLNWPQLLAYQELIIKILNNQFLTINSLDDFNPTIITRRISSFTENFLKEIEIHRFLKSELSEYASKCVPFIPKEMLQFSALNTMEGVESDAILCRNQKTVGIQSILEENIELRDISKLSCEYYPEMLDDIEVKESHPLERMDVNEVELSIQIFNPPYEHFIHSQEKIILLYALSKKLPNRSVNKLEGFTTGWRLIPAAQVLQVYENFHETAHILEVLSSNSDVAPPPVKSGDNSKKVSSVANKQAKVPSQQVTLSPGSEISDMELKVRTTIDVIVSWMNDTVSVPYAPPPNLVVKVSPSTHCIGDSPVTLNSVPFELNMENIRALAQVFNPIHPQALINNHQIIKFISELLKIDFL